MKGINMEPPYISTALGAEGTWYTVLLSPFMTLPNPWSNPRVLADPPHVLSLPFLLVLTLDIFSAFQYQGFVPTFSINEEISHGSIQRAIQSCRGDH
jgi:hypothetical protein